MGTYIQHATTFSVKGLFLNLQPEDGKAKLKWFLISNVIKHLVSPNEKEKAFQK